MGRQYLKQHKGIKLGGTMNYGHLQAECHRLLDEVFETKAEGYKWLKENFGILHFHNLHHTQDTETLQEIYNQLYVKSIIN